MNKYKIKVDYEIKAKSYEKAKEQIINELIDGSFFEKHIILKEKKEVEK